MANNPIVTIKMADGDIMKLELYPDKAPIAVNNFISLIKQGFYNGLTPQSNQGFHDSGRMSKG